MGQKGQKKLVIRTCFYTVIKRGVKKGQKKGQKRVKKGSLFDPPTKKQSCSGSVRVYKPKIFRYNGFISKFNTGGEE